MSIQNPEFPSMNRHEHMEDEAFFRQALFKNQWQASATTIFILLAAYYGWPFLAYNTTIKRRLYNVGSTIVPFRQLKRLYKIAQQKLGSPDIDTRAETEGNELEGSGISSVVQSARRLSGLDRVVSKTSEATYSGLGNWDNSCFQNSVLQGLASLSAFREFAQTCWYMCEGVGVQAPTDAALKDFLGQLLRETEGRNTLWPPEVLRSMDTWQQQDAQEYFSKIMDATDKEALEYQRTLRKSSEKGLSDFPGNGTKVAVTAAACARQEKVLELLHASTPANPLEGLMAQSLRCERCGYSEGVTLTSSNCLTLNMGFGGSCDLEDLLDTYTQPELIEGVECDECTRWAAEIEHDYKAEIADELRKSKVLSTKAKQILFGRLPSDLVFHVNRSVYDNWGNQQKNNAPVGFPPVLHIENQWTNSLFADSSRKIEASYELRCIVTHQGRHDNGHYVACGRRGKQWYSFSDEVVTQLAEDQVLSRGNVFMLFYERIVTQAIVEVPEAEEAEPVVNGGPKHEAASSSTSSESSETSAKMAPAVSA